MLLCRFSPQKIIFINQLLTYLIIHFNNFLRFWNVTLSKNKKKSQSFHHHEKQKSLVIITVINSLENFQFPNSFLVIPHIILGLLSNLGNVFQVAFFPHTSCRIFWHVEFSYLMTYFKCSSNVSTHGPMCYGGYPSPSGMISWVSCRQLSLRRRAYLYSGFSLCMTPLSSGPGFPILPPPNWSYTWEPAFQPGPCLPWYWEITGGPSQSKQAINSEVTLLYLCFITKKKIVECSNVDLSNCLLLVTLKFSFHKLDRGGLKFWLDSHFSFCQECCVENKK